MKTRLLLAFLLLALAVASAKNFSVTFVYPVTVNGTELKAGDYKLVVSDAKVSITDGKTTAEAAVKVEETAKKNGATSAELTTKDGKHSVKSIFLGGTKTRLVFE